MSETIIKAEKVSKKFCRSLKKSLWYGMQDLGRELIGREHGGNGDLREGEFWAVKDVNFELKRGQCLGLIGRNGAGKTTLLRMLNGLIKPDVGRIEMRGRTGALIALGAGFNPILTGRENIYVNASVLGLGKKDVDAKLEEIVDFAELGEFIDSPVQSYSSGMAVRLGFAISTTLKPDILLLDEVLAVGDAAFRHKCYHRISKLMSDAAVIMVSHSMDYIAHISTTVAMMRHGQAEIFNDPIEGVVAYNQDNAVEGGAGHSRDRVEMVYPPISRAVVCIPEQDVVYGGCLTVEVEIDASEDMQDIFFSFTAINLKEQPVMCWHTSRQPRPLNLCAGRQLLRFSIEPLLLHEGTYFWNFNMARKGSIEHTIWFMRAGKFRVNSAYRPLGDIPYLVEPKDFELVMIEKRETGMAMKAMPANV
jgi:lipopolysaccharide transport system ATP-binding protein